MVWRAVRAGRRCGGDSSLGLPGDGVCPLPLPLGMDTAAEEGLPIVPDTSKDPLDGQADTNSPSVSSPAGVRLVHVSIPSVSSGQVDYSYLYMHSWTDVDLSSGRPGAPSA